MGDIKQNFIHEFYSIPVFAVASPIFRFGMAILQKFTQQNFCFYNNFEKFIYKIGTKIKTNF